MDARVIERRPEGNATPAFLLSNAKEVAEALLATVWRCRVWEEEKKNKDIDRFYQLSERIAARPDKVHPINIRPA